MHIGIATATQTKTHKQDFFRRHCFFVTELAEMAFRHHAIDHAVCVIFTASIKPHTSTLYVYKAQFTSGSAMAEGPRDALVSRNSATTKYPYRMALFA